MPVIKVLKGLPQTFMTRNRGKFVMDSPDIEVMCCINFGWRQFNESIKSVY
jgi:hypothetical protein